MAARHFRTEESHAAERLTRDIIPVFLESKGLTDVRDTRTHHGVAQSQTIQARLPSGAVATMRVRLCWRHDRGKRTDTSAAQLLAKVTNNDWEGTINQKIERERSRGVTHLLLVQREKADIVSAALLPLDSVLPIWKAQRDISSSLIRHGKLDGRTKNHAMNGSSPTLFLRDDRAPDVPAALWSHEGVTDIAHLPDVGAGPSDDEVGAGYVNPAINRLVELAAVGLVRRRYESEGWDVKSVEHMRCGYDLDCRYASQSRHVEVKGVRGRDKAFVITAGELRCANEDPRFYLAVVTAALSAAPQVAEYDGMTFLSLFRTTAVQYRAALRPQAHPFSL